MRGFFVTAGAICSTFPTAQKGKPDLAGRFRQGLFFADEAHLDPRAALAHLAAGLEAQGGAVRVGVTADERDIDGDVVVDTRGIAGRDRLPGLRGVRGEMVMVRTGDVTPRN